MLLGLSNYMPNFRLAEEIYLLWAGIPDFSRVYYTLFGLP